MDGGPIMAKRRAKGEGGIYERKDGQWAGKNKVWKAREMV